MAFADRFTALKEVSHEIEKEGIESCGLIFGKSLLLFALDSVDVVENRPDPDETNFETVKPRNLKCHTFKDLCTNEPRYDKNQHFVYAKTKTQISFVVTAKLRSAFVFATRIVHSLFFLNPNFQASSHLLWLCNPVCVGPDRKPRIPVF